jgi:hypothetical protein
MFSDGHFMASSHLKGEPGKTSCVHLRRSWSVTRILKVAHFSLVLPKLPPLGSQDDPRPDHLRVCTNDATSRVSGVYFQPIENKHVSAVLPTKAIVFARKRPIICEHCLSQCSKYFPRVSITKKRTYARGGMIIDREFTAPAWAYR